MSGRLPIPDPEHFAFDVNCLNVELNYAFAAHFCAGRSVLDICFGGGRRTSLREQYLSKSNGIHSIDLSLAQGPGEAAGDEIGDWLRGVLWRDSAPVGPPQRYDLILAFDLCGIVDRPVELLAAISAALSPSGVVILSNGASDIVGAAASVHLLMPSPVFKTMAVTELGCSVRWFARGRLSSPYDPTSQLEMRAGGGRSSVQSGDPDTVSPDGNLAPEQPHLRDVIGVWNCAPMPGITVVEDLELGTSGAICLDEVRACESVVADLRGPSAEQGLFSLLAARIEYLAAANSYLRIRKRELEAKNQGLEERSAEDFRNGQSLTARISQNDSNIDHLSAQVRAEIENNQVLIARISQKDAEIDHLSAQVRAEIENNQVLFARISQKDAEIDHLGAQVRAEIENNQVLIDLIRRLQEPR
jgi:hypothetical protein